VTILKRPVPRNAAEAAPAEPRIIAIESDDSAPVEIPVQHITRDVPPSTGSTTVH